MKNVMLFVSTLLLLGGCKNEVVKKPVKLIDEEQMTNIIYDLAVLEAMRSQPLQGKQQIAISPKEYIYKKYHIDSLQFAESNHYYAADIGNYRKLYERVARRIEDEQKAVEKFSKAKGIKPNPGTVSPDAPQIK